MKAQLNVLIAEDEFIVSRNIRQQVLDLGYNVVGIASDEEEVMAAVADNKIDLILMDIMLKGATDGIEIARKIKQTHLISFVFITAYSSDEYINRVRTVEPHGYLLKPFNNRDLAVNIELAAYKHSIELGLREARQQLESMNLELEKKVAQRTEKLNEANSMLLKEIKRRKHNEDKVIESEQKYKELTEFLPIPVIETNKELEITYANIATRQLFKIEDDQQIQQIHDFIVQDQHELLNSTIANCIEQQNVVVAEFMGKGKCNSTELMIIAYFTPVMIDSVFSGMRAAFLDISQRVAMESKLYILSSAVEQAKDSIVIADKNRKIEYVNQAAIKEYGYSHEEIINYTTQVFRSNLHEPSFYDNMWRTLCSGNPFSSVFISRRKNDEHFYEEKTISPVKDKNGEIKNYISTGRDITEKIKAEKTLLENQKFINSINHSVPIIIFIFDLKIKKNTFVNNQIYNILGYSPEEVSAATYKDLMSSFIDYMPGYQSRILTKSTFKNGYVEELIRVKHKKTGIKWLNIRFTEFKSDERGNTIEIIGSATDITEQKQNERKLNAMMRLNRMQDKRTQKIRTLSLIQGQEEERRRISRDIHDGIGQMLTALKMNVENFDESRFSGEEKQKCQSIKTLIRDTIVEVRRISNALAPPGLYDFGLYSVTKQLLEQLLKTSDMKIHFDSNIHNIRYLPLVEVTLYRIIQESINNALKHSMAENLELSINQDDEFLNLIIFDDGGGMHYSDEHFNQNKSSGKGLRNIKERALFIGAKLTIISKPNEGCIIKITIPIKNCISN